MTVTRILCAVLLSSGLVGSAIDGAVAVSPHAAVHHASHDVARCKTRDLRLRADGQNGAGGSQTYTYKLVNTGTSACTLYGYPGVSVLASQGRIVQHAARRNPALDRGREARVRLAPHTAAHFLVRSTDTDPDPQCKGKRHGQRLRVYPPNQRAALIIGGSYQACELLVGAVFKP